MDFAHSQHAERARRKNRSSTNINHLTLAPLTSKLPLNDGDALMPDSLSTPPHPSTSYLQGKSAPTTPRLFTRAALTPRSRSHHRTPSAPSGPLGKSKSSTNLKSGTTTPRRRKGGDNALGQSNHNDSDWMLRTGVMMSTEAREYKGQAWLVSRQSSTSLAGHRDAEEEAFEQELAREREMTSRHTSRRGSMADDDATPNDSRYRSRFQSRSHSHGDRLTPFDREAAAADSYFPSQEPISGPDFVNLDAKLEELEQDTMQDDEAAIRRLVKHGQSGRGSWISNVIGWSLFSVDEDGEDSDSDEDEPLADEALRRSSRSRSATRLFEGVSTIPEDRVPPPKTNEGTWGDAAWLLSVASKVIF